VAVGRARLIRNVSGTDERGRATMKCFVIMPFANEVGDVYATIRRAVDTVRGGGAQTFRLDEVKAAGRITDDLVRELNESAICIGPDWL